MAGKAAKKKDTPAEQNPANDEGRKTFDMYSCFSRVDVILATALIVVLLVLALYFLLMPQPV